MKGQKIHTVCFHHYIYICPNQTVLPFKNQISKSRDARGLIHSHLARLQKGIYYMTKPHQSHLWNGTEGRNLGCLVFHKHGWGLDSQRKRDGRSKYRGGLVWYAKGFKFYLEPLFFFKAEEQNGEIFREIIIPSMWKISIYYQTCL